MDVWQSYPFGLALAFLFAIGMLRGQATYWVARTIIEQTLRHTHPPTGWRARVHGWLSSTTMGRGRDAVQRYGFLAVPLCYVTVGVQTVVLASAGVLRMRWIRFTLTQSVGALAWGLLYSTIGFAFWAAFFEAALAGGVSAVVGVAVVVLLATGLTCRWYLRTHRQRHAATATQPPGFDAQDHVEPAIPLQSSAPETSPSPPLDPATTVDEYHEVPR